MIKRITVKNKHILFKLEIQKLNIEQMKNMYSHDSIATTIWTGQM